MKFVFLSLFIFVLSSELFAYVQGRGVNGNVVRWGSQISQVTLYVKTSNRQSADSQAIFSIVEAAAQEWNNTSPIKIVPVFNSGSIVKGASNLYFSSGASSIFSGMGTGVLGVTQTLPNEDMLNLTREKAKNYIAFLMGGRSAEELILNEITSGASNDIERATHLARSMVCRWGMSDKLGPIHFFKSGMSPFPTSEHMDYSEQKSREIDEEVQRFVHENHQLALDILTENRATLERLAEALIVWETLDFEQIKAIADGKDIGQPQLNKNGDKGGPKIEAPQEEVAAPVEGTLKDPLPTT